MDFLKAIQSLGDLVYEFAVSLILIPRTLFKTLRSPSWSAEYLTSQSQEKIKNRFEAYSHPIFFWLVIGILSYYFLIEGLIQTYTNEKVLEVYDAISLETKISGCIVFFISIPVSSAIVLHLLKHRFFTKTSFKRSFYIQCYITAPLQMFYIPSFFTDNVSDNWAIVFGLLSIGIVVWFLVAEIIIIRKELIYNWWKTIGVIFLMYASFCLFVFVTTWMFMLMHMNSISKMLDAWLAFN